MRGTDDHVYKWVNASENFDNLYHSIMNLFVFMTNEGWVSVLRDGVDSRGHDLQPKRENNKAMLLFFITYMIVSNVFILNLFVGVIIEKFNRMHEKLIGYTDMNTDQRKWIDVQRLMMKQKLEKKWLPPERGVQRYLAQLSSSKIFEGFIMIVIVVNVILLAMPYLGNSPWYSKAIETAGFVFSLIYNVEAIIKIGGLRGRYFEDNWNRMDFFIVVTNDLGILMERLLTKISITDLVVVGRVLRVSRIFKVVKGNDGLRMLMNAINALFAELINIMGLLWLVIYIFAILGMNLFHGVILQEHYNQYSNFQSFGAALLLLIRSTTGEGWNLIMQDLAITNSDEGVSCYESQTFEEW